MVGTVVDKSSEGGRINPTGLALVGQLTEHAQCLATRIGFGPAAVMEEGIDKEWTVERRFLTEAA